MLYRSRELVRGRCRRRGLVVLKHGWGVAARPDSGETVVKAG